RRFDGLAGFQANAASKFFASLFDALRDFPQDLLAIESRHAACHLEGTDSSGNRLLGMRARRHGDRANYALIVRRVNLRDRAATDPLAIEEEAFSNCGSGDDAGHMLT